MMQRKPRRSFYVFLQHTVSFANLLLFFQLSTKTTYSLLTEIPLFLLTQNNLKLSCLLLMFPAKNLVPKYFQRMSNAYQSNFHVKIPLKRPQNFAKSSPYFWLELHRTKVRWRFRKILWPSQNIWSLKRAHRTTLL